MNQNPSLSDQLAAAPKQFCDNVTGGFNNETFLVAMLSGQAASVFAFTPAHMKKFVQWAKYQMDHYEKQFGEVKAEYNPNVPSPIKTSDLKKNKEDED